MNLPNFNDYDKLFYGPDLAKKDSQLAVLDEFGKPLSNFRFPWTKDNFLQIAKNLRSSDTIALGVSTSANAAAECFQTKFGG